MTLNGEEEFNKAVKGSDMLVAEFYAPWCGHCKSLAPEYEKAAKALKDAGDTVVLAKVIILPAPAPLTLLLPPAAAGAMVVHWSAALLVPYVSVSSEVDACVQTDKH